MSDSPNETDLLVAKMAAMEVLLLTLVRPFAGNPKFWDDVDLVASAFEGNAEMTDLRQRRWTATRGFIEQWRGALTPPSAPPKAP